MNIEGVTAQYICIWADLKQTSMARIGWCYLKNIEKN